MKFSPKVFLRFSQSSRDIWLAGLWNNRIKSGNTNQIKMLIKIRWRGERRTTLNARGRESRYPNPKDQGRTRAGVLFLFSRYIFIRYRSDSPNTHKRERDPYNSSEPPVLQLLSEPGMIHHAQGPTLLHLLLLSRRRITPSSRSYGSYKRRVSFMLCFLFLFLTSRQKTHQMHRS